jgi:hypothetical protein
LIRCDGCASDTPPDKISTAQADGNQARYCAVCRADYESWAGTCAMEERRLNQILDAFIAESRTHVRLFFVPQDLPPRTRQNGPLILG